MIREAELFVKAERMLVEVAARPRADQWRITVPPVLDRPGADQPASMRKVVALYARDDAWVPDMIAGSTMDEVGRDKFDGDLLGDDPRAGLARLSEAAIAAASGVTDGSTVVHTAAGDCSVAEYLQQITLVRAFVAHEIAMALGSRACPLPEDLSVGLFELTAHRAWRWRSTGFFREPLPYPPGHVSWRDQFLLTAGRDPHPWMD